MLVLAPKLLPWKMGPSCHVASAIDFYVSEKADRRTLIVKVARSNEGAVDLLFWRGGARWLPETTEALPLTCMPSLATLAEAGLMAADLIRPEIILVLVV